MACGNSKKRVCVVGGRYGLIAGRKVCCFRRLGRGRGRGDNDEAVMGRAKRRLNAWTG
jgi:hypothetical protein